MATLGGVHEQEADPHTDNLMVSKVQMLRLQNASQKPVGDVTVSVASCWGAAE